MEEFASRDTLRRVGDACALTAAPIVVVDRGGVLVAVNASAGELFGVAPDAFVGVDVESMLAVDGLDPVWRAGGRRVARRSLMGPAGSVFEVDAHTVAVVEAGEVIGAVVTLMAVAGVNPIASGRRAAAALQGEVLDVLPMPILIAQQDVVVYANRAAMSMFGVSTLDELRERERRRLHLRPVDRVRVEQRVAALARGEDLASSAEYRIVRPDGTDRVADWHSLRVKFAGEESCLYAVSDVTELADVRDSLASLEAFERQVLEALSEGVIVTDVHGCCTLANDAAGRLLKLESPMMLMGVHADEMPLVDLATGSSPDASRHPVWQALAGADVPPTVYGVRFGRRVRRVRVAARPIECGESEGPAGAVITFSDVTDEHVSHERLVVSERRFRELSRLSPVGIFQTDADGMCTYVNEAWTGFTGLDCHSAAGGRWVEAIDPSQRDEVLEMWSTAAREQLPRFTIEVLYRHVATGDVTSAHVTAAPLRDDDGAVASWLGVAVDLSRDHALRAELHDSERRFRELAERSPDAVLRVNLDPFRVDYASPSCLHILGRTPEQLCADPMQLISMVHRDDRAEVIQRGFDDRGGDYGAVRIVHPDGTLRWVEARTNVIHDGQGRAIARETTMRDVTDSVRTAEHLDRLANTDVLTGLPNRRALLSELDARAREGRETTIMFLDLDGFKAVNDTSGHDAGDEVLVAVASRLTSCVRRHDMVARLAGDEFVVVLEPHHDTTIAHRILQRVSDPIALSNGDTVVIGVSIGLTRFHDDDGVEQLLRRADHAMFEAKRSGKGRFVIV